MCNTHICIYTNIGTPENIFLAEIWKILFTTSNKILVRNSSNSAKIHNTMCYFSYPYTDHSEMIVIIVKIIILFISSPPFRGLQVPITPTDGVHAGKGIFRVIKCVEINSG